jgi:monoterpene epsilon-lactone hydrolase
MLRPVGALEFAVCLLVSAVAVTLSRFKRGPLLPNWSWGYEVITRAQKRFHSRVARRSPLAERRAWNALRTRGAGLARVATREDESGTVRVLWLEPRDHDSESVVLYLHGGGFMYGSERSHGELCARLALAARARVALVFYRLVPEARFPAALDDAISAYRALFQAGVPPTRVIVAGDSAGGNLALSLLIALRDRTEPLPAGAVLISPWVDLTAHGGSLERHELYDWASPWTFERWAAEYLEGADASEPRASPGLAELSGLPPLYISIGTAEMLHDQVLALAERAREAGVDVTLEAVKNRVHLWLTLADMFPEFQDSFDRMGRFVQQQTEAPPNHRQVP